MLIDGLTNAQTMKIVTKQDKITTDMHECKIATGK